MGIYFVYFPRCGENCLCGSLLTGVNKQYHLDFACMSVLIKPCRTKFKLTEVPLIQISSALMSDM